MIHLHRAWLFVKRGFLIWAGYRTALLLSLMGSVVSLVQFGWTARFVAAGHEFPLIEEYGGDLVAYFLVGSAFTAFVTVSLNAFQQHLRAEQQMGTLESLLLADVPVPLLAFYLGLWPLLYTLVNTGILFFLVVLLFRVPIHLDVATAMLVIVLTGVGVAGIGLVSAGVVLVTKRGDPVHWVFGALTGLFAGVFYPVEALPPPLRPLSAWLPTTYALHALRLALLRHASPWDISGDVVALLITCSVTLPLGAIVLHVASNRARRMGTLAEH